MKDEIERKWLVRHPDALPPWEHEWPEDGEWVDVWIIQTALDLEPNRQSIPTDERVREIRHDDGKMFTHTVKWPTGTRGHRYEEENEITRKEYKSKLTDPHPLFASYAYPGGKRGFFHTPFILTALSIIARAIKKNLS